MGGRGRAVDQIATATATGALLAVAISVLPVLGDAPYLATGLLLVAAPVLGLVLLRAALGALPRYLAELARSLDGAPVARPAPRTRLPEGAQAAVDLDALLRAIDRAVSRHRIARIEAEDEDKSETAFLTDLSHELRTPLNAILGFSSVLLEEIDGPLSEGSREDIETIRASGDHLRQLVDDVLDMAALHSGRIALRRGSVDPSAVVKDVARLLEAQRRDKPVVVRTEIGDGIGIVDADEMRFRQIAMNLGTNALKFTERGEVVLSLAKDATGVRLTVRDTGPGIPPGRRDDIFLEFTQISNVVMRRTQGSGLGLSIVKRLTELHGGRIWLESVMGEGSSFHVWLPTTRAAE